jgi:DNA-binding SARP family transcriptional activator
LFGCWGLRAWGREVELGRREQRLVALLALRGRRPRPYVSGTLWPSTTETRAQASLRAAVLRTRQAVPGLLDVGRATVALAPEVVVDVHEVLQAAESLHGNGSGPHETMTLLMAGELLPGWYDDWVLFEKERLQHVRLRALESLAESQLAHGRADLALAAALEAVAIEPLRETAHSLAIRAHLLAGNRSAAVREYREYQVRMEEELGIALAYTLEELARPPLPAQRRPSDES